MKKSEPQPILPLKFLPQDDSVDLEILEQIFRSRNAPSRDFEEVAEELGIGEKRIKSCRSILKEHHEDLKHDPERLSTKFIADVAECSCRVIEGNLKDINLERKIEGMGSEGRSMNKFTIVKEITKCEDCDKIDHHSFLTVIDGFDGKPEYKRAVRYNCGRNGNVIINRDSIPDWCPRLKEGSSCTSS